MVIIFGSLFDSFLGIMRSALILRDAKSKYISNRKSAISNTVKNHVMGYSASTQNESTKHAESMAMYQKKALCM